MRKVISGFMADLLRSRIRAGIFVLAFLQFKNLRHTLKAVSEIKSKRMDVQGSSKIRKFFKTDGRYFFIDNIPGWPSEAFKGYIRKEINRHAQNGVQKTSLSTVFVSITSKCPLRCNHCYERENLSTDEFLSLNDLKAIIKKLKDYGVNHIQLSGGEPLSRFDDLLSLIDYSKKDADIWINTSGFGLTREKALMLKKAGLTGAEISLDHWDETSHNIFRGNENAYRWAIEAARNCSKANIITSFSLCATNSFVSKDNLLKFAKLASSLQVSFIRLLEPKETATFNAKEVSLSDIQISELEDFFLTASVRDDNPEFPIISYPSFHQRREGCLGAGNRYLYIDPRGEIHACPFCRHPAGNAVTGSIEEAAGILRSGGCRLYKTNLSG